MFGLQLDLVFILLSLHVSDCSRRILGGQLVTRELRYMVYLVKAPISPRKYDAWLCGGAIVSTLFIITSAACVDDVQFLYAIAGYNKYVNDSNLDLDPCTKEKKKKIIYTCIPVAYELRYELLDKWSFIDIALVKVESPYDFTDNSYLTASCSYIPSSIAINYEAKYQEPGTDAMVAGWGHAEKWRRPGDETNYNAEYLHYTPTLIFDKEKCKQAYEVYPNMGQVIEKYMICTLEVGNIDERGYPVLTEAPINDGCASQKQSALNYPGSSCEGDQQDFLMDNTRREVLLANQTYNATMIKMLNKTNISNKTSVFNNNTDFKNTTVFKNNTDFKNTTVLKNNTISYKTTTTKKPAASNITANYSKYPIYTRRNGICQNDHGGPIVTWVGAHEVLIGVASVFKVSEESKCIGPFLFTSTQCNGAFLDCVLNSDEFEKPKSLRDPRRSICDSPPSERGYDTIEKHISWLNHPAGPSDNEKGLAIERNRANGQSSKDRYGAPQQYPQRDTYGANQQYPQKDRYGANQPYPQKDRYGANEPYPQKDKYGANQPYPQKDSYAANGNYGSVGSQYGNAKYGAEQMPLSNDRFGQSARYAPPKETQYAPKPSMDDDKLLIRPQRPLRD